MWWVDDLIAEYAEEAANRGVAPERPRRPLTSATRAELMVIAVASRAQPNPCPELLRAFRPFSFKEAK